MNKKAKYTKVNEERKNRIDKVRDVFSDVYDFIESTCKSSREASLALTKLEEAQFWAIKGISREKLPGTKREDKEPILTDSERRYLEAVLRPLPKVAFVKKVHDSSLGLDQIFVMFATMFETDYFMCFPPTKWGTGYKGMETLKEYTPEELGLNLGDKE